MNEVTTPTEASPITDAELLVILSSRDWARSAVQRLSEEGVHEFHTAHALISECIALIFRVDINVARTITTGVIDNLVQRVKQARDIEDAVASACAPEPPTTGKPDSSNVVTLRLGTGDGPCSG